MKASQARQISEGKLICDINEFNRVIENIRAAAYNKKTCTTFSDKLGMEAVMNVLKSSKYGYTVNKINDPRDGDYWEVIW